MEKKEAVYTLERLKHTESKWPGTEDVCDALEMAIDALKMSETGEPLTQAHSVQVCPVCHGKGMLPTGFYGGESCGKEAIFHNRFPETCRTCFGKGVVETGKEQNGEPLILEQMQDVPHGKVKDSTLQSICNRANEIAAAKADLERAKIQAFVVTEYCPHCEKEQSILWDAGKDGYEIYCPTCGEKIMLCSVCDEFDTCDWREDSGCKKRKKG